MTTTQQASASPTTMDELRAKQQVVWSSGDYNKIAAVTVPLSEKLVETAAVAPGQAILDIASGTGHAALAAARIGGRTTAIDYVPALLDIARRRADAEDLQIEFVEAAAEQLPFQDGSFDVVLSAIGVMFSADHHRAAAELVRVTRPGGRIALASWTPSGFVGGMLGIVGRYAPPPPGAQPPVRWGQESVVAELLGEEAVDVSATTHVIRQRFASAEDFADLFITYYGPTHVAFHRLGADKQAAFRADLVAHAAASDISGGPGVVSDWEYCVVTATRRDG
jgi:SAM-dependent methyltransferase